MNRKILSVLLICMMLFSITPTAVFAADGDLIITATMENETTIKAGDIVTVDISFDKNPGLFGFRFLCKYDPEVLKFESCETTSVTGFNISATDTEDGVNILGYGANMKDEEYVGSIATVQFAVTENAMGKDSSIELELIDENDMNNYDEETVPCTLSAPIEFTVEAPVVEPETYAVTVSGGTANPEKAKAGETVTVTANVPAGKVFNGWTGDVTFADASKITTTFTMPASNVTVTANYEKDAVVPTEYTVTVNGGTADLTKTEAGKTVTVTANVPAGKVFNGWTGDVTFADASKITTTFTMPEKNVTVTANFKDEETPVVKYAVNVTNGTTDKVTAAKDEIVTIKADTKAGFEFKEWKGNVNFTNKNAVETTFTMPAKAVNVEATYSEVKPVDPQKNTITVTNGTATVDGKVVKEAAKGDKVTIKADSRSGYTFKEWKGNVTFADKNSKTTTFVMGDKAVAVEATYTKNSSSGGSGGGGGVVIGGGSSSTDKDENEVITNRLILNIDNPVATYNNNEIKNDVAPIIVDGRTYTPARFVAEKLGATVDWNEAAQLVTVTSKDKKIVIELTIGSNTALVNGEKVEMDAAAFIQDSRTYTPARFVAEQLGAEVVWNAMTRQVIVTETVEVEKETK